MSLVKHLVEIIANKPLLMRADLMIRYGRDEDTIDRWHATGVLPKARYLPGCNSPFWSPADIESNEQKDRKLRALAKASGAKKL